MSVLDEIVKAYDVRGTVPDQLNAEVARALGVAFARYAGADGDRSSAATCARPGPALVAAFTDGVLQPGRRRRRHRPGVVRPGVLRRRPPRPARRDVHGLAQPGRVQRRQVLPRGRPAGRRRRARRDQGRRQHRARRARPAPTPPAPARAASATCCPAFVDHVLSFVDRRRAAPAAGRRRHRQRHGRPRRAGRVRAPARRSSSR